MDYKEKYEAALNSARKLREQVLNNELLGFPDQFTEIFPELTESEDERTRKELLVLVGSLQDYEPEIIERWAFWLEKQKEQKPDVFGDTLSDSIPDDWRTKLSTNDSSNAPELKAENMDAIDSCMLRYLQSAANRKDDDEIMEDTRKYKQELLDLIQKPAEWSEEDEFIKNGLIRGLKAKSRASPNSI